MTSLTKAYSDRQKEMKEREVEILSHPAWHGDISGVECEDLLRGLIPGSYLLREGERKFQYYLSFVIGDSFSFKHQPFLIIDNNSQMVLGYRNGAHRWVSSLKDLIPMVLHCSLDKCHLVPKIVNGK
jgi:hypothetical protein